MQKNIYMLGLLALLAGCGGSSDSSTNNSGPVIPPQPPEPTDPCVPVLPLLPGNASIHWQNFIKTRSCGGLYNGSQLADENIAVLPDFSYAGYQHGERDFRDLDRSSYTTYDVTDYGLNGSDNISDKAALKTLISQISDDKRTGQTVGAMIYFPAGRYILNDATDKAKVDAALIGLTPGSKEYKKIIREQQTIIIQDSDIIIKGDGVDQTTLYSSVHLSAENPNEMWSTPYLLQVTTVGASRPARTNITSAHFGSSSKTITVANASTFKEGDKVELQGLTSNINTISKLVTPYQLERESTATDDFAWTQLTKGAKKIEKHIIRRISGNKVTFYTPVLHQISADFNWSMTRINSVDNIGVEDLALVGNWQEKFEHHGSAIHDSGYSMLQLNRVDNSWLNNIKLVDINQGISIKNAFNVSAENITVSGNKGHLAMTVQLSNSNLIKNVNDNAKTWHAPGVSNYTIGNVYLNLKFDGSATNDLHGGQSMDNLFDLVTGGFVYGRWGATVQNQPNHLKGLIYWNPQNTSAALTNNNFEFMNGSSEYGRIIMPYIIGMTGNSMSFASQHDYMVSDQAQFTDYPVALPLSPQAIVESMGMAVYPPSLYQAQKSYRQSLTVK